MLYHAYERQADLLQMVRTAAQSALTALTPWDKLTGRPLRYAAAANALLARAGLSHQRPAYGIGTVMVGNRDVPVTEEAVFATPFGTLLHFKKDIATPQPRMLVVAPLSGHFATLLRNTVRTLLADHDVYITDWHNARDVSLADGAFGFDDYVDHVIRFLEEIGPGAHVLGVCQPCVQVLAAVALMAEDEHPAQPCSMTLMAGPVDTRVNPTKVNELATERPLSWFERHLIDTVPPRYRGAGPPRLSGLHAAPRLHVDERRPAREGAPSALRTSRGRRERGSGARSRLFTTSISRCSTCRPSSISRRSSACSRRRTSPAAC